MARTVIQLKRRAKTLQQYYYTDLSVQQIDLETRCAFNVCKV